MTNPYTRDVSVLVAIYRTVMNDGAAFVERSDPLAPEEAELIRLRLFSEFLLYTARVCEALVKQLLYCTNFSEGNYRGIALGALISQDCDGCRASGKERHRLSLLGSLAHRYGLCVGYEKCLERDLPILNKLRDVRAAHSGIGKFRPTNAAGSRRRLKKESLELGEDFLHRLEHISQVEINIWGELASLAKR